MINFCRLCAVILALFSLAHADVIASCKNESGIISCNANESGISNGSANLRCQQKDGQTICNGSYQDLSSVGIDVKCDHANNGNIKCSGGTADGYKFSMSCINQPKVEKMKCEISDSLNSSLTLTCNNNGGIPDCFGLDNISGESISVGCSGDPNGEALCSAKM